MKICTLASGSSGNCLYVESGGTRILVDAGISLRQIVLKLRKLDVDLTDINAVIVTHEHSDHTAALRTIGVPVHVASATTSRANATHADRLFAQVSFFGHSRAQPAPRGRCKVCNAISPSRSRAVACALL